MKTVTAKQARIRLGELMDSAQTTPVAISKNGKPYGVLLSAKQFEALGGSEALDRQVLHQHIDARLAASEEAGGETAHEDLMAELKALYAR